MAQLFRSKSCSTIFNHSPPYSSSDENGNQNGNESPITTPFLSPEKGSSNSSNGNGNTNQLVGILVAVLRKSLVTCSVEREMEMEMEMEIGSPKNVKHVSHVTFDRFNGFLGLPVEFQPEVPTKVPSASASVFGVSANSMQCSYDQRRNSVPTILLMMQKRLYSEGGLQAEGIFRINAENDQEQYVRNQMNKGFVPRGIDIHCLAGLIKAWLRELPTGVLDSLTPEQVMHCNTEEECTVLVKLLPPTEAALLDWAINLMADVVQHEHLNKMNARNIAMVFAPNMTQMADPLTALIHAVQVMNFLKTLIIKTLREREESATTFWLLSSSTDSPNHNANRVSTIEQSLDRLESEETDEKFWSFQSKVDDENAEEYESISGRSSPVMCKRKSMETGFRGRYENGEVEGILNRLNLRKGVRKLCSHPVFQLSKMVKKSGGIGVVNT